MFLAPVWTYQLFHRAEQIEKACIALDNASIRLGQSAREVWNGLRAYNSAAEVSDLAHHAVHTCARNPLTASQCVVLDQAMEKTLLARARHAERIASAVWQNGLARAIAEGRVLHSQVTVLRPTMPSLRSITCTLCGLPLYFERHVVEFDRCKVQQGNQIFENEVHSVGQSLRSGSAWNYRVMEGAGVQ